MNRLKLAYYGLRYLGPRMVGLRTRVYVRRLLGVTRSIYRDRQWQQIQLADIVCGGTPTQADSYAQAKREQAPPFLFPLGAPPRVPPAVRGECPERRPALADRIALLRENRCVYFARYASPEPIDWHANPVDGMRSDPDRPWFELPDYQPQQGDPRMLWEPSRAMWALDCARAYADTREGELAALYWRWADSWMAACPPFLGYQWKCGQESAVRLIAMLIGFWSVARDPLTGPERFVQMARLAWATGYRIEHHIHYAISQKNNHALSEACGLLLIGQLFPELRRAQRWRALGRRVIQQEIPRQVYDDGSYVQHSMNYQRVMLQVSVLALRLAELAQHPLERGIYDCLARSGRFLWQMMDPQTGRLPMYGDNDGAYVLPLSECDFLDYRPAIQAVHYLVHRQRAFPPGPWDEDLLWLFGAESWSAAVGGQEKLASHAFRAGGYYTLRGKTSWLMMRSHTYRDRPAHCDQLHVDLWWRGLNVAQDCGTYKYYCPDRPDVELYFRSVLAHNTIELDGVNSLERVSRFLWVPWPRCETLRFQPSDEGIGLIEAASHDYDRRPVGCLHRRTVLGLPGELWVVVDDVLGEGPHDITIRWHLMDVPFSLDQPNQSVGLQTPAGRFGVAVAAATQPAGRTQVIRGREDAGQFQGFASPYYGQRVPIPTLEVQWHAVVPHRVVSSLGPGSPAVPRLERETGGLQRWSIAAEDQVHRIDLTVPERSRRPVFRDHQLLIQREIRSR